MYIFLRDIQTITDRCGAFPKSSSESISEQARTTSSLPKQISAIIAHLHGPRIDEFDLPKDIVDRQVRQLGAQPGLPATRSRKLEQ